MTEVMKENQAKLIARGDGEPVKTKVFHYFTDCSLLSDDAETDQVTDREVELLALKPCRVCERRLTGGPAIEALTELIIGLGEDVPEADAKGQAWYMLSGLKERGFYIAQRKVAQ